MTEGEAHAKANNKNQQMNVDGSDSASSVIMVGARRLWKEPRRS